MIHWFHKFPLWELGFGMYVLFLYVSIFSTVPGEVELYKQIEEPAAVKSSVIFIYRLRQTLL